MRFPKLTDSLAHVSLFQRGNGKMRTMSLRRPPADLVFRVTGQRDIDEFLVSGQRNVEDIEIALALSARSLCDFREILDFGCGCGRLTIPLREAVHAGAVLAASDSDRPAVEWLRESDLDLELHVNETLPPLPFAAARFDLIIGWSVLTHLDEAYQNAWLQELSRVARPSATVLLTVHGVHNWRFFKTDSGVSPDELRRLQSELAAKGFAHWRNDGWEKFFPDYYHTSWHLPRYINRRWSRWFDVIDVYGGGARPTQDIVVLNAPNR
jgi:SAM-dependent methyltransferase